MAMTVKNNLSATRTLNVLNRNSKTAQKSLRQAATGMKIVDAQDDASAYAISERMRVRIRALDQAHQNVQNGSALLKIGMGGIDNIVEELRSLKELAINAANDTNTDEDRRTIQKEFVQRMETINDIATTTAYNGKTLLDGTHANRIDKFVISAGDYTITEDGVYSLADGYTGTVTVNAQNVKLTQETPATQLVNVSIITSSGGNANLWIEDLNIINTEDKNIIKFQGADNYLTVKGKNIFHQFPEVVEHDGGLSSVLTVTSATINVGNGLTLVGDGSLTLGNPFPGYSYESLLGANIGSDAMLNTAGDVTIADNIIINASGSRGAAIGSGQTGTVGNIRIGGNAKVTATSIDSAGIGSGINYGSAGNIEIGGNANVTAESLNGAGIGTGEDVHGESSVGNITISSSATVNATSTYGEAIGTGSGSNTSVGTISIGETTFDIEGIVEQDEPLGKFLNVDNALRIQSGDSANQSMNLFIEDMHTKSLGAGQLFDTSGNLINASDINRYNALNYDTTKQAEWLATLKTAENLTLDDISVTTRTNANLAIRVIDGAIEYALDQATTVGAYLSRLEYTSDNVTTSTENVQASESTIRDADMAKAISSYTRYNVLTQTAQSMLAQANQNANAVLGLLR